MRKLRILFLTLVSYLTLNNSYSQVRLDSDGRVSMPKNTYKSIRIALYTKDTIIYNQRHIITLKDSIITLDSLKFKSFEAELQSKNNTIDTLSKEYKKLNIEYSKEKTSLKTNYKFWLGIVIGSVGQAIIFTLAK